MNAVIGINIIVLFAVLGLLIYAICKLKRNKESQLKGEYQIKINCDASQAKESLKEVRAEAERLQKEIADLKNPPKPAKFKVGDRAGNFAIWKVDTSLGIDEPCYKCIDANGGFYGFRESQIEAMIKLNQEAKA